ncbi:APC amino acid permease [Auriscalpium vulgare]|uniref:APC amino acid permease n=1 Tax=Auriscalpium vulgare TaxID=40419 RepID=A0ACB8RVC6_9AGAM|nr:APC amino acid permease [Auriscalpium vulgare]
MPNFQQDDDVLVSLGYKQELKRDFHLIELFGLVFCMIGVVPAIASVLVYALPNGGPAAMVWGWAGASVFLIFVALAMAELGSAMPTSGGLYYWTHRFSSPRFRNYLAWEVGYINTVAYVSGIAGIDWGCAIQIMAAVSIGTDLEFIPTTGQIYGVFCALLVCHATAASLPTRIIARIQSPYVVLNVLLLLGLLIAIPVATPSEFKNDASFALGNFTNLYRWTDGFAFILSFLAPLWVVGGFDASVHVSEEARNAQIAVPFTVVAATVSGCVLGWALNLVLAFHMGPDVVAVMSNQIGQPLATILFNSFGKKGTLCVWCFIVITQFMSGLGILTVSSRQNFAFSRDGAFPFSRYMYRLNPYTQTPVNSVWMAAFLASLLGLLAFAGPAAIGAVFTMSVIAQYISNSIPIVARFVGGREFKHGPFKLGIFGLPVAVVAVSWMTFMSIVLLFPTAPHPTSQTMNYSVVVVFGVIFLSSVYYFFPKYGGIHWFKGPVVTVEDEGVDSEDQRSGEKAPSTVNEKDL